MAAGNHLPSNQSIGFLDMPLELRYPVYEYCLICRMPINMAFVFDDLTTSDITKSLLLVSKAISSEALDVFYGKNIFEIRLYDETGWQLIKYLTEENLRRIRKVQLVMTAFGALRHTTVDWTSWMPILTNLTRLTIVAQQPLNYWSYDNPKLWEDSMEKCSMESWTAWLEMLLANIGGQLPASCMVEVDHDHAKETNTLIEQYFPNKYRYTNTWIGDCLFGKQSFNRERRPVFATTLVDHIPSQNIRRYKNFTSVYPVDTENPFDSRLW